MVLMDTHVHYHFADFDEDRDASIERAREQGIQHFLNVGTDLESTKESIRLTEQYEYFHASAGFHPHEASKFCEDHLPVWKDLARHKKVVAIGEVGLDFFRNLSPRPEQERLLHAACGVARVLDKPLILHVRDAFPEVFAILKEEFPGGWRGVFHCFSGDVAVMRQCVEMGFHISFAGPVTYKKNNALRQVAGEAPLDRIVIETDAPFLPPESKRGQRNESALMVETARCVAEVRKLSLEELALKTTENASRLFGIQC